MIITNLHNLPSPIYNAVSRVYPPNPNRLSATALIGAPLVRQLQIKHWPELSEDATDRLWALLGQGVHAAIDGHTDADSFAEEKLVAPFNGIDVVCKSDNWKDGVISDYKVTSVFSFMLGEKVEWENQLNVYAWAWRKHGFETTKAEIHAILRDWSKGKIYEQDYPKVPFATINVKLWTPEEQESYVAERVRLHLAPAVECTPEEKWARPTTWAVMKEGRKSALRVLDTEALAYYWAEKNDHAKFNDQQHIVTNKNISIVERKGGNIKCESYCPVRSVCPYVNKG
jgi:hypothetical protein